MSIARLQKHAACVVKGGKVVSVGHNSHRTYFAGEVQASLHAEMAAILAASSSSATRGSFSHSAPARQAAGPQPASATFKSPKGKHAVLAPVPSLRRGADSSGEESDSTVDSAVECFEKRRGAFSRLEAWGDQRGSRKEDRKQHQRHARSEEQGQR